MRNNVRFWIGLGATIALIFAFWVFFKSANIRNYVPKNATFCIEFNLKQIFQKIDISDPNQTKDIADFFNNELEEDPSLLIKIFKNIANNPSQSGIDFSISPIYAQLNNQSNLFLFAINSRSKLNQLLAKQKIQNTPCKKWIPLMGIRWCSIIPTTSSWSLTTTSAFAYNMIPR
jgi:hypothetical protein